MNAPTPAAHLAPEIAQREVPEAFLAALKARFGNNCSTAVSYTHLTLPTKRIV